MHTLGPWETSRDAVPDHHVQITVYEQATGTRVATAFETPDNARLIAAAPDLLTALQGLEFAIRRGLSHEVEMEAARAAIAKATGN